MASTAKWKGWKDPECAPSFFSLRYLHAHSHIINTHTRPRSQSWTLKHEMNMSSVNFDWHFHTSPGFMEHYIRIWMSRWQWKNSTKEAYGQEVRGRWVNTTCLLIRTQHNPSAITQTQIESQRGARVLSPRHKWRYVAWKHSGALTQQLRTTTTVYYCWSLRRNERRAIINCIQLS